MVVGGWVTSEKAFCMEKVAARWKSERERERKRQEARVDRYLDRNYWYRE